MATATWSAALLHRPFEATIARAADVVMSDPRPNAPLT